MKYYFWQDYNDPHTEDPNIREETLFLSKAAAKKDFKEYASELDFDWTPKMQLWKVTVKEVT